MQRQNAITRGEIEYNRKKEREREEIRKQDHELHNIAEKDLIDAHKHNKVLING